MVRVGEAVRTVAITGSGSGMGAALQARLEAGGDRVIGIDVKNVEIDADLGTAEGRARTSTAWPSSPAARSTGWSPWRAWPVCPNGRLPC